MLDKISEINLLFDFYGELLPGKQQEIVRYYYEDNLSLGEIGTELNMTRQGVHEALKRSGTKLMEYEKKLGLAKRFLETEAALNAIDDSIDRLLKAHASDAGLSAKLAEVKSIIDGLNQ